ncbi:MAG: MMPL family transporter [Flavobacteriales bacterium]|nr:MMPL family transporter [Flavobacteriales bacterium]
MAQFILKNRILLLALLLIATVFMAYQAKIGLRASYGVPRLLPETDSTYLSYVDFRSEFGEQKLIYVLGVDKDPLEDIGLFTSWQKLGEEINKISGVDTVLSVANNLPSVVKDTALKKFDFSPIISKTELPKTAAELTEYAEAVYNLPFYKNRLYNDTSGSSLMFVTIDSDLFLSNKRSEMIVPIFEQVEIFEKDTELKVHLTGLPYIRTVMRDMVQSETLLFIILAFLVTTLVLFLFFRTKNPVFASLTVVLIGVVWSLGSLPLFGYEVNVITSLIPPLIIVIAVPNCIYLINKYHSEYKSSQDKEASLIKMIKKIGSATLLTNLTTAMGFFTFVFTESTILKEFGIVAAFNVICLFIISIVTIPIILSYVKPPTDRHLKHLDHSWVQAIIDLLVRTVSSYRKFVYLITVVIVIIGVIGISMIETTGNMTDDLPENHKVIDDLKWAENQFKGVMPFEVVVDTRKKNYVKKDHILKKIDQLQSALIKRKEFSAPLSVVEGMKFIKQAFYNGDPKKYDLISKREKVFFNSYLNDNNMIDSNWLYSYVDTNWQRARINFNIKDIGTKEMDKLLVDIQSDVDSIFSPRKYDVAFTGPSLVFLKGTTYLSMNLFISLGIAIGAVALLMALLFRSLRMIFISLITNFLPLILTAAAMGFFEVPIKPSTILVFSIAFGISVDDTIHFLAKYRQELKATGHMGMAVLTSLKETGVSMMYTSFILFFGFSVFISSDFGGAQSLGFLVSFTLLVAMLANLFILPSFLLSQHKSDKKKTHKNRKVPVNAKN